MRSFLRPAREAAVRTERAHRRRPTRRNETIKTPKRFSGHKASGNAALMMPAAKVAAKGGLAAARYSPERIEKRRDVRPGSGVLTNWQIVDLLMAGN